MALLAAFLIRPNWLVANSGIVETGNIAISDGRAEVWFDIENNPPLSSDGKRWPSVGWNVYLDKNMKVYPYCATGGSKFNRAVPCIIHDKSLDTSFVMFPVEPGITPFIMHTEGGQSLEFKIRRMPTDAGFDIAIWHPEHFVDSIPVEASDINLSPTFATDFEFLDGAQYKKVKFVWGSQRCDECMVDTVE